MSVSLQITSSTALTACQATVSAGRVSGRQR